MVNNIPEDLLKEFRKEHEYYIILDFKIKEDEIIKVETIYYEHLDAVGVMRKTTFLRNNFTLISDERMAVEDINILLEKCSPLIKNK